MARGPARSVLISVLANCTSPNAKTVKVAIFTLVCGDKTATLRLTVHGLNYIGSKKWHLVCYANGRDVEKLVDLEMYECETAVKLYGTFDVEKRTGVFRPYCTTI